MTEHHAISRRAFTLGLGLAALSPFVSLPETAGLGLPVRAAFADDATTASANLNNFVIRLRPAGYFRTASVNEDGNVIGNVCHLFNDGTSSKLILENVTTKNDDTNWYAIRTLLNFEEHKKTGYSIWSVDGDSDKDGKVIHVWSGEHDGKPSRSFAFERQSNGTYIIRDRTVEKETEKKDIKYLAIESNGEDQDNNKICHKSKSIPWELELIGYDMKKNDATVSSLDWITYSSYVDGPCWMKYVDDNKFLDELSIPGTHDSGTCSVDNDTEPQSSQVKCQQDFIPTQLLEGIRYFDIRLGKGDNPGIDHGMYYLLKKDAYFLHLSDVIGYFKTFLNENPTEALIMLVSRGNDEATDESVTTAFAKVLDDNPKLFYTSSRVPTLGEVRGKIVLLRRFGLDGDSVSGHTWGLDLTEWDNKIAAHTDSSSMCLVQDAQGFEAAGETGDKEPYCTKVYAQDKYKLTGTDKLSWVDNALKETTGRTRNEVDVEDDNGAKEKVLERCWSINYTSCTGLSHGGNPFTSARVVNEHLYKSPYINPSGIEDTKSDYLISYSILNKEADFYADNISFNDDGFPTFDVYKLGDFFENISLSVPGRHNVLNALACIALCDFYGIGKDSIKSALSKFTGAHRRFEFKGIVNGARVFDDYGHHPTEIVATANSLKNKKYNESWVVFQPHTYSRTKNLLDDFANALTNFDHVIVLDIYAARESNVFNISSQDLVDKINLLGKHALYISDFENCVSYVKENVKENDIILTLGAGTVTEIGPMLLEI